MLKDVYMTLKRLVKIMFSDNKSFVFQEMKLKYLKISLKLLL